MQGSRSRRAGVITPLLTLLVLVSLVGACDGGGGDASRFGSAGAELDEKAACAALDGLARSSDALDGVDIGDPEPALAALDKAVAAYGTALATFARVGPANLRASAEKVGTAVAARRFTAANEARAPIDAWARKHCAS